MKAHDFELSQLMLGRMNEIEDTKGEHCDNFREAA